MTVDVDFFNENTEDGNHLFNAKTMTPKNLYGIYPAIPFKNGDSK